MKSSLSIFIALIVAFISTGCFGPSQDSMPPPTPPPTFPTAHLDSPLGNIDPNMEYEQNTAGGTPQLDRPLSKYEKLEAHPAKLAEYKKLQKKKEWHRKHIKQAEMDRMGADIAILDVIQGGAANLDSDREFISSDMNANPRDPEQEIKHQRWIKSQADLVINELSKDLAGINREMDKILNESTHSCFPKGTQVVMFDGSTKNIDEIIEGDSVMVYNIGKNTIESSKVKQTWVDKNNHLYVLNDFIQATAYERLLTESGWKKMRDIQVGEKVFNGNSYILVKTKAKVHQDINVYNLSIEKSHNFFVATKTNKDNLFLVHNTPGGGSSSGSSGGGGK